MKEINFEMKAAELITEIERISERGISFEPGTVVRWHGIRGISIDLPRTVLGVNDLKEMQAIIELAWAQHCLEHGA